MSISYTSKLKNIDKTPRIKALKTSFIKKIRQKNIKFSNTTKKTIKISTKIFFFSFQRGAENSV